MTEMLYSKISQPKEIRRSLLLSSKNIIEVLKATEEYKLIKEEKLMFAIKLKKCINEMSSLVHKIKSKLPSPPVPKSLPQSVALEEGPVPADSEPKPESPLSSQLESIEEELAKLEQSLGKI